MTTSPSPSETPAAPARKRDSLFLLARLRLGGGTAVHDVRVRNLSEGGLMAEYDRPVTVDTPVSLELRGVGEIEGRVVWCEDSRLGIAFDRTIDPKAARKPVGGAARVQAKAPPRR